MIEITIPGYRKLRVDHLVMDYNGTLAVDGKIIDGVKECLAVLAEDIQLHVVTADTFGEVRSVLKDVACELSVLPVDNQDIGKLSYVKDLGVTRTVCIGNGRNDRMMLKEAALGIAVILNEGAWVESLLSADIVCTSIVSALELLIYPLRLTATLRS